jgi:hypothetical protein
VFQIGDIVKDTYLDLIGIIIEESVVFGKPVFYVLYFGETATVPVSPDEIEKLS